MDLGIEGKVALVTGGSRGLGRYSALALAREGANVAICGRTRETLERALGELKGHGIRAAEFVADMASPGDPERLHEAVVRELGPVDILVNNVGGSRGARQIDTATAEELLETFNLNVMGAFRLCKLVVPAMRQRGWGRIINISSVFGREYGGGLGYMTAKAALIAVSKHLALSLAKDGITVNCVAPGSITFPGSNWERFQREQPAEVVREFIERDLPMGRFGWPEPVADTVAFLASARADLITGACINVDGGQSRSLI